MEKEGSLPLQSRLQLRPLCLLAILLLLAGDIELNPGPTITGMYIGGLFRHRFQGPQYASITQMYYIYCKIINNIIIVYTAWCLAGWFVTIKTWVWPPRPSTLQTRGAGWSRWPDQSNSATQALPIVQKTHADRPNIMQKCVDVDGRPGWFNKLIKIM